METSRRSIVAALALSPVVLTSPTLASSGGRSHFEQLIAAQKVARLEWEAHPYSRSPVDHPELDRLDREDTALMHRDSDALKAIILCPAPDHRAIVQKIEIIAKDWLMDGSESSYAFLEAIRSDVQRLGGGS